MFETSLNILILLLCVGFIAGFVDSIAGGGGLITMPALLLAGVLPLTALGTNKFQGLFGTATASFTFMRKGHLDFKRLKFVVLACFLASAMGAVVSSWIPSTWLENILPIVLILVALYFLFSSKTKQPIKKKYLPYLLIYGFLIPFVGFYDGILGPGAGSFYMLVLLAFAYLPILQATAETKIFNFASNLGGFLSFSIIGAINWEIGIIMAIGQILGANLGAHTAINNGARIIRPFLVIICIATAIKLLFFY